MIGERSREATASGGSPTQEESDMHDVDALAAAYAAGEVSPVEVTPAALDRIRALDGELGAFVLVDEERALERNRRVDGDLQVFRSDIVFRAFKPHARSLLERT